GCSANRTRGRQRPRPPPDRLFMPDTTPETREQPAISVVVPVRNEAGNVAPLADEIAAALKERASFELIYVNDGSTDGTEGALTALKAERPWLRQIKHAS